MSNSKSNSFMSVKHIRVLNYSLIRANASVGNPALDFAPGKCSGVGWIDTCASKSVHVHMSKCWGIQWREGYIMQQMDWAVTKTNLFVLFWDRISCSLGWPWTSSVADDNLELWSPCLHAQVVWLKKWAPCLANTNTFEHIIPPGRIVNAS